MTKAGGKWRLSSHPHDPTPLEEIAASSDIEDDESVLDILR